MHSTLATILMIRDKDLRKWGRLSAVMMTILGLFLIGVTFYINNLVFARIEPTMHSSRAVEEKMVKRIADQKLRDAFYESLESNHEIDRSWLKMIRAFLILTGTGSLLLFYTAALSWRSYELALTAYNPHPSCDQVEQEIDKPSH